MQIRIGVLKFLTLLYISFGYLPFFLGWLRMPYGLMLSLLLLYVYFQVFRATDFVRKEYFPAKQFLIGILLLFVWVAFSGAGGMGLQVSDIKKINTIIKELTERSWPLDYLVDGRHMYFSHYMGYFLPGPTLVGFLGYKFVQLFLFFYTFLGVFLGVFWLFRYIKGNFISFVFLFVIFGGISAFSLILRFGSQAPHEYLSRIVNHGYVFWLNCFDLIPINFNTITDMMYWVHHHAIAAFIGVGVMLNDAFVDKNLKFTPLFVALLLFWSPLVTVGLAPILLFVIFRQNFRGIWTHINLLIAPLFFIVTATFLLSLESENIVKNFIFSDKYEPSVSYLKQLGVYLYFLFFEVYVWAIPIVWVLKKLFKYEQKGLFLMTIVVLSLIPLYRFGLWNDWSNRVSMPFIIILALFAYKALYNASGFKKYLLLSLYALGAHGFLIGFGGSFIASGYRIKFFPPEAKQVVSLPEVCIGYPISQFVAPENSFFYKYLGKQQHSFK